MKRHIEYFKLLISIIDVSHVLLLKTEKIGCSWIYKNLRMLQNNKNKAFLLHSIFDDGYHGFQTQVRVTYPVAWFLMKVLTLTLLTKRLHVAGLLGLL